jgi:hypothetical protein
MEAAIDTDPQVEEILEEYGAVSLEDLGSSDAFQQLSAEEQQQVREEIWSSPAFAYACEVLDGNRADELASKKAELGQSQAKATELDETVWVEKVSKGLGAAGLTPREFDGAQDEIQGLQDGLTAAGPSLLENWISDFDPTNPWHLSLHEALATPLASRSGSDPNLVGFSQILGHLVQGLSRNVVARRAGDAILRANGQRGLPLLDADREAYIENWSDVAPKPITSMAEIKAMLKAGPWPNRTGKQVGRDIARENLSVGEELKRAARQHDRGWAKETARRHAGQYGR